MEEQIQEETRKVQKEMHDLFTRLKHEEVSSKDQMLGCEDHNMALLETAVKKAEDTIFPRLECLLQKLDGGTSPASPCCGCPIPRKQIPMKKTKTLLAESFRSPPRLQSPPPLTTTTCPRSVDEELFSAVERGKVEEVRRALDAGADVDDASTRGETPLQAAAWNGDAPVVALLLAKGADPNRRVTTMAPLHYASFRGHSALVSLLIRSGADVNVRDECGMTPLHNAALQGHMECVLVLLDAGADASRTNDFGDAPRHVAIDAEIKDLLDIEKIVVLF